MPVLKWCLKWGVHSEALTDEPSLLRAMAYVDLNSVPAGIAETPETSDYTSIKARLCGKSADAVLIKAIRAGQDDGGLRRFNLALRPLIPFRNSSDPESDKTLPIRERDYLLLIDATARARVHRKAGCLDPILPLITERLGLTVELWIEATVVKGRRPDFARTPVKAIG